VKNSDLEIKLSRDWLIRTGFWFGLGCAQVYGGLLLLGILLSLAANYAGLIPTDATDKGRNTRSGLSLKTDYGTGCQYLVAGDAMTPRLDSQGLPICGSAR
jgi:hypothetical protein